MSDALQILTEKEKQTLRLMGRGHDAKSMARQLDLSVHTVNERLRAARRKLCVSSSREAARMLIESEGPELSGDRFLGDAGGRTAAAQDIPATPAEKQARRLPRVAAGVVAMTLALALAVFALQPQAGPAPTAAATSPAAAEDVRTALNFLTLVDASRWEDSYRATGRQFRTGNSLDAWTRASEAVRANVGAIRSRTLLSAETVPAPPNGYRMIRFRSSFAKLPEATETVTLEREGQDWKVVAIIID